MALITISLNEVESTSRRRKKQPTGRSAMLKLVMPQLSGELGKNLIRAVETNDSGLMQATMDRVARNLHNEIVKRKRTEENAKRNKK